MSKLRDQTLSSNMCLKSIHSKRQKEKHKKNYIDMRHFSAVTSVQVCTEQLEKCNI